MVPYYYMTRPYNIGADMPGGPSNGVIAFHTSSAKLLIGDSDTISEPPWSPARDFSVDLAILAKYPLLRPNNRAEIRSVVLDKSWYAQNGKKVQEFIVIARHKMMYRTWDDPETEMNFLLMLVEWDDGVAYRVQLSDPVREGAWWGLGLERNLVVLG